MGVLLELAAAALAHERLVDLAAGEVEAREATIGGNAGGQSKVTPSVKLTLTAKSNQFAWRSLLIIH